MYVLLYECMNLYKIETQKDVELDTLRDYLHNKGIELIDSLLSSQITEPTDIRYDNVNYQITIGDQETIEKRRKFISKYGKYNDIRSVSNIAILLLSKALTKKIISSDINTILLVEVANNGGRSWNDLKNEFDNYTLAHPEIRGLWKEIYAVFPEKNIKLFDKFHFPGYGRQKNI